MKRSIIMLSLALSALPLTACVEDGYTYGGVYMGSGYPYDGYYDGYYGSIYDGYWGTNGYFYFRLYEHDRNYRRGDRNHFRRPGDHIPHDRFRPMQGHARPQPGTRMPKFGGDRGGGGAPPHRDGVRR